MSDEPSERDPQVMADLYVVGMENAVRGLLAGDKALVDPVRLEIIIGQLYTLADEVWRAQDKHKVHIPEGARLQ